MGNKTYYQTYFYLTLEHEPTVRKRLTDHYHYTSPVALPFIPTKDIKYHFDGCLYAFQATDIQYNVEIDTFMVFLTHRVLSHGSIDEFVTGNLNEKTWRRR